MPHILIVDDDPIMRTLVRETLLIDPRLSFTEAENGMKAFEQIRLQLPDLILLDIRMPVLDGLQTCHMLHADPVLRAIPVILVTAYGSPYHTVDEICAGANDFLIKPFEGTDLIAKVESVLQAQVKR